MSTEDIISIETVIDDGAPFFAPVSSDVLSALLGQYQATRAKIEHLAELVNSDECRGPVQYFLDGNSSDDRRYNGLQVAEIFDVKGAIFSVNADFWGRALSLTDVYDCMPQARRDYWNALMAGKSSLRGRRSHSDAEAAPSLPDFEEDTVRSTLRDLLAQRATFFAERVDGIFRGLSGEHVTNSPAGFGKRMIMGYMLSYGSIRHERAGVINDLRCVIAKFMGRDEPKHNASDTLIRD